MTVSNNQTDITGHTGYCLQFWIYNMDAAEGDGQQLLQLTKDQSFHAISANDPCPLDGGQGLNKGLRDIARGRGSRSFRPGFKRVR